MQAAAVEQQRKLLAGWSVVRWPRRGKTVGQSLAESLASLCSSDRSLSLTVYHHCLSVAAAQSLDLACLQPSHFSDLFVLPRCLACLLTVSASSSWHCEFRQETEMERKALVREVLTAFWQQLHQTPTLPVIKFFCNKTVLRKLSKEEKRVSSCFQTARRSMGARGFVFWSHWGEAGGSQMGCTELGTGKSQWTKQQRASLELNSGLEGGAKRLILVIHLYLQHTRTQDQLLAQSTDLGIKSALWTD